MLAAASSMPGLLLAAQGSEILRNAGWTLFLFILLGNYRKPGSRLPLGLKPSVLAIALCYAALFVVTLAGLPHGGLIPGVAARVGMAVLGMLLVEQVYRNKTVQERWMVKFACLGIGAMFGYDFYMYTHAMLFHEMSLES